MSSAFCYRFDRISNKSRKGKETDSKHCDIGPSRLPSLRYSFRTRLVQTSPLISHFFALQQIYKTLGKPKASYNKLQQLGVSFAGGSALL